ncbi:tetratricopeptide repeat protein [Nonomuraea guangzhouensis]|uniref:Tetratricopeptide repeat protein n=1 Tax=Nonomuraea guangzhouensis TaxID=1291555 RepID=A0ABW4GZ28_9ACTN|nr:tetratricopeptide repeat protein [Nonomuraea guangzhouensis]
MSGQVSGGVVQARDIGSVTIGAVPPPPVRIPRQLPAMPPGFVNRTTELALLDRLLEGGPAIAVVSGLKGVGKSAVSRRWAHQVHERFSDGQLYADFGALRHRGGTEVSDVLGGFLRAFGVHEEWIPAELPERAAMFRSMTADLRLLVLLDDAEHAAEVTPLFPASAASAVVVTSHRQLGELLVAGARPVRIAPLQDEEGVRLLAGMLGEDRVAAERERVSELVRLCGGLPIALRVAGARLVQRPTWTVDRLVGELADAERRLDQLMTEGRAIVEAVFDSAYTGLPEQAARLYRLLGTLPGPGFSPGVARAVLDGDPERALDLLLDASLVEELDGDTYRFHDLVRLHAARCARRVDPPEAREAALRRVAEWYLRQVAAADAAMGPRLRLADHRLPATDRPFATPGAALDWLEKERANVLALLRAAAALEWDELVWQLAEALWPLYHARKHYADWIETNRLGVAAALRCGDRAVEARMRNQVARAQLELGETDQARAELVRAHQAAREAGEPRMEAVVLESLGQVALARELPDDAITHFAAALAVHEGLGNPRGVGMQSYHLGLAHSRAGRYDAAIAAFDRALALMTDVGDELSQGKIHLVLGEAHRELGHRPQALRSARTAADIMRERRIPAKETRALELLADLADDRESAEAYVRQALAVCLSSGNLPKAEELRARLRD